MYVGIVTWPRPSRSGTATWGVPDRQRISILCNVLVARVYRASRHSEESGSTTERARKNDVGVLLLTNNVHGPIGWALIASTP